MTSLWFVVPAHGRIDLSAVCLRQLRRVCDELAEAGISATAVVVADDENLDVARDLGFATVERDNLQLGRKFNDGYEAACRAGADYVVPCGSDDWIDPALLAAAPISPDTVTCFTRAAFVNETADTLSGLRIDYQGGIGIRVIPAKLLEPFGYRPAEEDRRRAIDTSVWRALLRVYGPTLAVTYFDLHQLQIVDFKTEGAQLNTFSDVLRHPCEMESPDPFGDLAGVFPAEAVAEMRGVYAARGMVAAA